MTATNSILVASGAQPLIDQSGNVPAESFRGLLSWSGQKNFFQGVKTFWRIAPTVMMATTEEFDLASWQRHWGAAALSSFAGDVRLEGGVAGGTTAPWDATLADFALQFDSPAIGAAADNSDAGADLSKLVEPASSANGRL